eukprot:COSAG01_NODE_24170_length_788_cov_0.589260_1_plen_36_part_10
MAAVVGIVSKMDYVCPTVLGRMNSVLHIALCATTCD